jgi:LacI family transcriptional regulator
VAKKRYTIKDVARMAGVSVSTVSLVINKKGPVSEETRRKVLHAVHKLDYHPRRVAQGLASQKTGNIGFILTDDHFSLVEPFYTKIFLGTEVEARKYGYYIILTTVPNQFSKEHIPRFLLERNVDGVIMAGRVPEKLIAYIRDMGLPVTLVDYYNRRQKTAAILIDNIEGAYQAVTHLIELGHKKIGFVGGDLSHPSISDRLTGFKKAMEEHGLPIVPEWVITTERNTSVPSGYQAMNTLLKSGELPTAIFACNDAMAIGCLRRLKESGIRVPDQIALIGFDDIDAALQMEPRLSTIHVYKERMGALAMQQMASMLENGEQSTEKVLVPVELVIRESTARKAD